MLDLAKFLDEYIKFVMSVASEQDKKGQVVQGIIGISTESGELLDALKKNMFQQRPLDTVNVEEECGDILFYMTELLEAIDSDIFKVMAINQHKLESRYDGKRFDKDKSLNRDLVREREILEQGAKDEVS